MFNRGQILIGFILLVALISACISWTHQYRQGRRCLDFWGSDNALLIRHAPYVELFHLTPAEELPVDSSLELLIGQELAITSTMDISDARGLVHARQAFIEDVSFQWEQSRGNCIARWDYALRFFENDRQAIILLDFSCHRAQLLGKEGDVSIAPIADGVLMFLKELLPAA